MRCSRNNDEKKLIKLKNNRSRLKNWRGRKSNRNLNRKSFSWWRSASRKLMLVDLKMASKMTKLLIFTINLRKSRKRKKGKIQRINQERRKIKKWMTLRLYMICKTTPLLRVWWTPQNIICLVSRRKRLWSLYSLLLMKLIFRAF